MLRATVVAPVVSTIKHASMSNQKLLLLQPLMADGKQPDGDPIVALDSVGAGSGDTVVVTSDGRFARELVVDKATPVRWTVVGIEDGMTAIS